MDLQALNRHAKSKKHVKAISVSSSNITFLQKKATEIETDSNQPAIDSSEQLRSQLPSQSVINSNAMRDDSVAEILWAMKSVVSLHHSFRSCDGMSDLFVNMFPDSKVANEFSMGRGLSFVTLYVTD